VDVLEAEEDLRKVEFRLAFGEKSLVLQQVKQLTAGAEVHHEMEVLC